MSETNSTKQCTKCKNVKPLSAFYKNSRMADGLQYACKVCCNKRSAEYQKTDAGKRTLAKYYKTAAGKRAHAKGDAKYKAIHPAKRKAKDAVANAIKSGRLTKLSNCEECPNTGKLDGHHDDYALPLMVRWLCSLCHNAWHRENGPGLNG